MMQRVKPFFVRQIHYLCHTSSEDVLNLHNDKQLGFLIKLVQQSRKRFSLQAESHVCPDDKFATENSNNGKYACMYYDIVGENSLLLYILRESGVTWKSFEFSSMGWIKAVFRHFSVWTSASGLPHVAKSSNKCTCLFWTSALIVCVVMFIYQMTCLIMNYLDYPVTVDTKLKFQELIFPVVTVCNLSPFKLSKVKNDEILSLIETYKASIGEDFTKDDPKWNLKVNTNDTPMEIQTRAKTKLNYITARMTDEEIKTFGTTLDDFIMSCTYNELECDKNYFVQCLSFKTKALDFCDILPILKQEVDGFELRTLSNRLGYPYSQCVDESVGSYSVEHCYRQCFQDFIVHTCGCGDPRFPLKDNQTYCGIDKFTTGLFTLHSQQIDTFRNLKERFIGENSKIRMRPYECTQSNNTFNGNLTECLAWYSENTLMVEVYYERLNYQLFNENPAYPIISLISDFGGQIGLWIGFSVITMIECLFIPFMLIRSFTNKDEKRAGSARPKTNESLITSKLEEEEDNMFDHFHAERDLNPKQRVSVAPRYSIHRQSEIFRVPHVTHTDNKRLDFISINAKKKGWKEVTDMFAADSGCK
uniref:Uncharacterized protein n=1 Tax=Romanomermis culicivorax TaxID=13658 RepID=A0A915JT41_ROMCU